MEYWFVLTVWRVRNAIRRAWGWVLGWFFETD